jgi:hypothetical protein
VRQGDPQNIGGGHLVKLPEEDGRARLVLVHVELLVQIMIHTLEKPCPRGTASTNHDTHFREAHFRKREDDMTTVEVTKGACIFKVSIPY